MITSIVLRTVTPRRRNKSIVLGARQRHLLPDQIGVRQGKQGTARRCHVFRVAKALQHLSKNQIAGDQDSTR
jgi:hypothetical protein